MLSGLGLRTVTCDGNPQLPNACGTNNQSSPLVCLSHTWSWWCPGFLLQWTRSVGMLSSDPYPLLPWLFAVVCKPHQWLLLLWDLELQIWVEPGAGSCLSQSFCVQLFPPATRCKLCSVPGCVCRVWDGAGGGSPAVGAVLNEQAMQLWMEGKVGYCSTSSLCSGSWGDWEKETELVWSCFKPAHTQFPLPLLTLLPAKSFC